ncbi:MAG: phosphatidate cytidylyltransferase [bacterium]
MDRIKTPLVVIPVLLLIIHWGVIPFSLLVLAVIIIGLLEFYRLTEKRNYHPQKFLGVLGGFFLCLSFFLFQGKLSGGVGGFVVTLFLFLILIEAILKKDIKFGVSSVSVTFLGIFYISWFLSHLILLRDVRPHGEGLVYLLFITTWCVDTGAFWAGVKFGRHKLSRLISPNKSWEGAIFGLLTGIGVVFGCRALLGLQFFTRLNLDLNFITPIECLVIGLLLGIGGQVGDLAESLIKRNAGVKDSGNLFPGGHGGMLDKADSLMFNTPLLYYYVQLFLR